MLTHTDLCLASFFIRIMLTPGESEGASGDEG
jgi:hypothetical protein